METVGIQEEFIAQIVKEIIRKQQKNDFLSIPVGVSNRHVHVCREDLDILFGTGYELSPWRELSQKGYYAAKETVVVAGPQGALPGVRLLGPLRPATQIELLLSDAKTLGIKIPIRDSGTIARSEGVTIIGPQGIVVNNTGVMAAWRHIHMNTAEALALGLQEGDAVQVKTKGDRALILANVKIRLGENFITELHVDVDEAFAAQLKNGDKAEILINSKGDNHG